MNSYKSTTKTNLVSKYTKDFHRHFLKEDTQMAPTSKHMKRCFTSLVIREQKSKTHNEIPLPNYQDGYDKQNTSEDVKELECLYTAYENGKWCSHCREYFGSSSGKSN